jgi:transposase
MEDAERQQLLDVIASQAAEIAQLKQTIDALVRRIFGAKSEALDPAQLELLLGSDLAKKAPAAAPADPGPAAEIPSHQKPARKQARAPRIPEHLPLTEEKIIEPAEVLADPAAWRRIGEEVREQLHYQRGSFSRIRTVRPKYVKIGDLLTKPIIAPLPPSLQDRCIATPALIAEVLDNRFVCHLPYYRQAEMFARLGVRLHRKTLCDWALLASDWLAIIYRQIQHEHWRCTYRQLDETPINYLEPGHGKTKTGYLWVSNIPGGSVIYHWRKGRDQGGITDLFDSDPSAAAHPTVIQSDGYSAYPAWSKGKDHITLMGCHAHVRRKFFEAQDQSPRLVGWILRQLAHLYQIEGQLRETQASPVRREAMRAWQSRPIHQRLKKLLDRLALRRSILPKSNLGKAITYALNQWPNLQTYLADGRVEIDNNLVENAIRPTKLGAKNWLFIGREDAGEKSAILYTLVENCRRLGINPRDYFEDVLTRLPGMIASEAASLTPANWLAARSTNPGRTAA